MNSTAPLGIERNGNMFASNSLFRYRKPKKDDGAVGFVVSKYCTIYNNNFYLKLIVPTDDFCSADDDWQRGRSEDREQLKYQEFLTFERSKARRFEARGHGKEWKKNKRLQRGSGKSRHEDFTPEFQFYQQNNQTYENIRENNSRDYEISDFPSRGHSQDYKSQLNNKTSKKSRRQRADFQKPGSSFPPRQGGFQVRNDRFVAMKSNHNMTVSFRK